MVEKVLVVVIQEVYVYGVLMCLVDDLVKVMGVGGMLKSQVSCFCVEIDE